MSGSPPLPPSPTVHAPGTPEKVAVLAARYAAGYALWHDLDAGPADGRPSPPDGMRAVFLPRLPHIYRDPFLDAD